MVDGSASVDDVLTHKRCDPVTRVVCKGVSYELELTLDINSEVYRLRQNEKFTLALVSTLDLEGKPDDGTFNQSGKVRACVCVCVFYP